MSTMIAIALILVSGYLLGSVRIRGLQLGTSAILVTALFFGHFGCKIPSIIREAGLVTFVASVGFIAGPVFFRNLKSKAPAYVVMGALIVLVGTGLCVGMRLIFDIPVALCVGMFTGALTSTPGLAAAIEATGDSLASVGYGIAYPFGVVGVVLFVQLVPKLLRLDMEEERRRISLSSSDGAGTNGKAPVCLDDFGFFPLAAAIVLGLLVAKVAVPLPGGASFSLGSSGGPLLAGLVMGHFRRIGGISISVPKTTLEILRELGLALFLMGAGTDAGAGFLKVLREYGVSLFLLGAVMTVVPMVVGYAAARKALRLEVLNTLGSICGGMTSTPALGALINVAKTDDVAASYAASYPVALVFVVLASQFMSVLM